MRTLNRKGLLITIILIFYNAITANAQWTQIQSIYGGTLSSYGASGFSIGNKGYVIGGSATNKVYVYDPLMGSWSIFGSTPPSVGRTFAMPFVINGKAYIVGGDTFGISLNTVWEFDPAATVPWVQKANFPGGKIDDGFSFALNNKGYIGGGTDGISVTFNDIWKYDPSIDSWSLLPDSIPISGLNFPVSFVIGNKGYFLTGGTPPTGFNEVANMWCIDGSNDSVYARASFGGAGRQMAFAFSNNSYGYVGGGNTNLSTNFTDMWKYDPVSDSWSMAPASPLFGNNWSSAFAIGNTAYVGLGGKWNAGVSLSGDDKFYKFEMDVLLTGIKEGSKPLVEVYPNPSSEYLTIRTGVNEEVLIEMFSSVGANVMSKKIQQNETFSITNLPQGSYYLKIISQGNTILTRKIIVTR